MLTLAALHPELLRVFPLACTLAFVAVSCLPFRVIAQMSQRGHHAPKIDYAKADKHALATPSEKTTDLQTLATHLTQPFKTEQEKTRAVFRWVTHNISYDYPYYQAICREAQCNWDISKAEHFYDKRQSTFAAEIGTLKKQKKTMKPAGRETAGKSAQKDRALKELLAAKANHTKEHKAALKQLYANLKEAEKALQVFTKKGHHIQDAATVLKRGFGVCAGYSALFHALAEKAGFQSATIGGSVKMSNRHIMRREGAFGHAWNAVRIKNKWWMLDCTWADEGPNVDEHWFLLAPEQAIHSHFARDTAKQFLAKAITEREFLNLPPESEYSRYDAKILDAQHTNITTDSAAVFTVSVPPSVSIAAYQGKVEDYYVEYSLTAQNISISSFLDTALNRKIVRVRAVFPKSGDYHVALRYNGSQMMSYYVHADSGGAKAVLSDDTTTIKPAILKQPVPERVIRIYDPTALVLSEPTSISTKTQPQSRLQSRSRGMLTFVVNDARLGGKFVERFEQALEKRDIQRAVALCDTLVELFPGQAGSYFLRGMTRASAGEHRAAIEDFSRADSLESNNPIVWLQRGISRYRVNDFTEAVRDVSRAMEWDDNLSDEGLYWRGLARVKMNLQGRAFRDLWEAHERGNQDALPAVEKYCAKEYALHKERSGE
ncbi:MAG: hypothetical protein MUF71_11405 [Candidatus Kapabacteria bacterium]|jgi:predicted Zn-dependent protease|nr:hypothetical protein [Candidatus Kapabacteria bacterium]